MEESNSSSAQNGLRPSCQYGDECYRTNPSHRLEIAHPGDEDYSIPRMPLPIEGAPKCKYGRQCYRTNYDHFRNFRHPRTINTDDSRTGTQDPYDDEESEDDPFADSGGESDYVPSEEDD